MAVQSDFIQNADVWTKSSASERIRVTLTKKLLDWPTCNKIIDKRTRELSLLMKKDVKLRAVGWEAWEAWETWMDGLDNQGQETMVNK